MPISTKEFKNDKLDDPEAYYKKYIEPRYGGRKSFVPLAPKYWVKRTKENLAKTIDDPESLFAEPRR